MRDHRDHYVEVKDPIDNMLNDSEPESLDWKMLESAVEAQSKHPAIQQWYRGIQVFECPMPPLGEATFVMAVLQDRRLAALVWSDGPETWGTSGWVPLAVDGSFQQNVMMVPPIAHRRPFHEILDVILETHRRAHQPLRPWWQFW